MKTILRRGLLALAIMALTVPADAGPFEDGLAAAKRSDYATALLLWRPLAEQGNATAQYNLGLMQAYREGVPHDTVSAHMWFNLAAAHGHENGQAIRGMVEELMSPDQIADAQRMAFEWMAKHQR